MTYPIPGVSIGTPYGKRGSSWSCNEDSSGKGVHTGVDFPCPEGTSIYAPIAGQIRHRSYGSAFGNHQFAISPDPGQPFAEGEVFFAHTKTRLNDGAVVKIGDFIGYVGNEGNSTGPHLHMEYHKDTKGSWSCSVHDDPQPVLDHAAIEPGNVYLSKLVYGQKDSDSVKRLQVALNEHPLEGGQSLPISGNYLSETDEEVRLCQKQHGFGSDPVNGSSVGPKQAEHLFAGTGNTVVNDLPPDTEVPPVTEPPEQPETITFPLGIVYHYSGKPGGTFTFGSYKKLDVASWAPPEDGYLFGMIYANVDGSGEFKSRLIREDPADETAYQTHYPKSGDNYLTTHVWFEACEGGRKLHYELGTADGETMHVGTRYVKFLFIPKSAIIDLGSVLGTYQAARSAYQFGVKYLPKALVAAFVIWVVREIKKP